jgi:hypothetical protein
MNDTATPSSTWMRPVSAVPTTATETLRTDRTRPDLTDLPEPARSPRWPHPSQARARPAATARDRRSGWTVPRVRSHATALSSSGGAGGPAPVTPGSVGAAGRNSFRDKLLNTVDEKVRRISDECDPEACRILLENRDKLDATVEQLLAYETLDEPEVYAAAGLPRPLNDPLRV